MVLVVVEKLLNWVVRSGIESELRRKNGDICTRRREAVLVSIRIDGGDDDT
jgi:hypothetical protein